MRLTSTGVLPLVVVGRYASSDGSPFADPVMRAAARALNQDRESDLIVDGSLVRLVANGQWVTAVGVAPAHPLRLEDLDTVRASLARARAHLAQIANAVISTPIDHVIAMQRVTADAATLVALALAAQTLAVAWAAQALLVAGIARARAGEWGIARLRGFRRGRLVAAIFSEPIAAVVIGSSIGYLAATAVARVEASSTGVAEIQPMQALPLTVGGLAALGSLIALILASVRSATMPLAELLRTRSEPRRIGRIALVAQSGALLATVLVVYSVVTGGQVTGPQLPLLAPALLAVTVGFLALRVALPLLQRGLGPVPKSLAGLLIGRRILRLPSLLATALMLCTAVALTTAATQTLLTSSSLEHQRAEAVVGASRVLEVHAATGTDLVAAVRRADPTGRMAMAAVDLDGGSGIQRVVAVDTTRLEAVSTWHSDWSGMTASRLRHLLSPHVGSTLRLTGGQLQVNLADTALDTDPGGSALLGLPALQLSLTVQNETGFHTLILGRLNRSRYTSALPCLTGCRIVGFNFEDVGIDEPWAIKTTLASISTDKQTASETAPMLRPRLWRQQIGLTTALDDPPKVRISQAAAGLALSIQTSESRAEVGIVPRDTPQPVPVLLGPQLQLRPISGVPGSALGSGLGYEFILAHSIGQAKILPRALGDGVLVDLSLMQKITDPATVTGRSQVWLSAAAGRAVIDALRRQGLDVIGQQRLTQVEMAYRSETVFRVAEQGAGVGVLGLVLALTALLVTRLLARPASRRTAKVLFAAGASQSAIKRLGLMEAAIPAITGSILGAAAGYGGALLLLPTLPLGAGEGLLPPLDLGDFSPVVLLPVTASVLLSALIAFVTTDSRRSW